jgi:predicted permease
MTVLKSESARAGSRGSRLRRGFVIGQITLSFVLLACAGLFLRSLQRATRIDAGFDPRGVQIVGLDLDMDGYNEARSHELHRALLQRVGSLPGVTEVGFVNDLPLDFGISQIMVVPDGWTNPNGENSLESAINTVGGGYFQALRIPLLQGRSFDSSDTPESMRVVLISRAFAERVWPGQNPLGRQIRYLGDTSAPLTVIGVVGDVKHQTLMETIQPSIYIPTTQNYQSALTMVVRSGGRLTAGALRTAILEVDPRLSMSLIQPLEQLTNLGTMPQRVAALITTSLGLLALILSALGVYGVIAFMVAQRTREIGTRMALGASRAQVLRLILRDGARLAAPGFALGFAIALALGYLVRTFILGVTPTDPLTFTSVSLALLTAIALACWIPALRASGLPPSHALKTE